MQEKTRPAFGVKAEREHGGNGWVGVYWAPGITPGLVRNGPAPMVFSSDMEAKNAAAARLFDVLNSPRDRIKSRSSKVESYAKLTGAEFADLLKETGLSPTAFAFIYGTSDVRVFSWIDGVNSKGEPQDVPHPARVLLEIFKENPDAIQMAQAVTESVTVRRSSADRVATASSP